MEEIARQDWFIGFVTRKMIEKCLKNSGDWTVRGTKSSGALELIICVRQTDGDVHEFGLKENMDEKNRGWVFDNCKTVFKSPVDLVNHVAANNPKLQLKQPLPRPSFILPPDSLEWEDCSTTPLGKGQYGTVVQAVVTSGNNRHPVAVKIPRSISVNPKDVNKLSLLRAIMVEIDQMFHEAEVMKNFDHPNVLKCFGIDSSEHPSKLVLELCPGGSLLGHLRKFREEITFPEKMIFIIEAARGLKYLHQKHRCIHRDLAARNCLIGRHGQVVLSDFGISMIEEKPTDNEEHIKVPIPWLAPECLASRPRYSQKSDVFSFAILMNEIITSGEEPWPGYTEVDEITKLVRMGKRMNVPEKIPSSLKKLLISCWAHLPYGRPESWDVVRQLREIMNNIEFPSPEQRTVRKTSKEINVKKFNLEESSDLEIDELSPPPTTEEIKRIERIQQQRQKPSSNTTFNSTPPTFSPSLLQHKNRTRRKTVRANVSTSTTSIQAAPSSHREPSRQRESTGNRQRESATRARESANNRRKLSNDLKSGIQKIRSSFQRRSNDGKERRSTDNNQSNKRSQQKTVTDGEHTQSHHIVMINTKRPPAWAKKKEQTP